MIPLVKPGITIPWKKFSLWVVLSILLLLMGCENPVEVRTLGDIHLETQSVFTAPSLFTLEQVAETPEGKGMAFYLSNPNGYRIISAVLNGSSFQPSPILEQNDRIRLLGYSSLSRALIVSQSRQLYRVETNTYHFQQLPNVIDQINRAIIGDIRYQEEVFDILSILLVDEGVIRFQLGNSQHLHSATLVVQNNNLYNVASRVQSFTNIPGTDTLLLATRAGIHRWILSGSQEPDSVIIYQNLSSSQTIRAILAWNRCLLVARLDSLLIYDLDTMARLSAQQIDEGDSDFSVNRLIGLNDSTVFGQLNSYNNYYLFSCPGGNAELKTFSPEGLSGSRSGNYGIDPTTATFYRLHGPFKYGYFDFVNLESGEKPWSSRVLFSQFVDNFTVWDDSSVVFCSPGKRSDMVLRYHFSSGKFDTLLIISNNIKDIVRIKGGFAIAYSLHGFPPHDTGIAIYDDQGALQSQYSISLDFYQLAFDPPSRKFFGFDLDKIAEWEADNPSRVQIRTLPFQTNQMMLLSSGSVQRNEGNFWFGIVEGGLVYVTDRQLEHTVQVLKEENSRGFQHVLWSADGRFLYFSLNFSPNVISRKQIWLGP